MADSNLPGLAELNETPADADELYIVDKSDTTDGATGTNKKITRVNLVGGLQAQPAEGAFVDGDKTKLDGIETAADVTDASNVASAGALMTDGSAEMTGDVVFAEKADHSSTPAAGKGYLWVKNTAPSSIVFTDDSGADTTLGAAGTGISNVVEDTTPQLGGDLDAQTNSITNLTNINGVAAPTAQYTTAEETKLAGIETAADVTDATNVTTAMASIGVSALSDVDTDKSKTPADGDVLTFDGTHWNAEAAAGGGGGQTLYDVVLDAGGGGDYTDWSTAMGALTSGQTLFVRSGTYTESTAFAFATANVTIVGEDPHNTILRLSSTSNSAWSANNLTFTNIRLENTSSGRWQFSGNNLTIRGCEISAAASFGFQALTGSNHLITSSWFECTANDDRVFSFAASDSMINGCYFDLGNNSNSTSNGVIAISNTDFVGNRIDVANHTTANGVILSCTGGGSPVSITGNTIKSATSADVTAIYNVHSETNISGNNIYNFSQGILAWGQGSVTGNRLETNLSGATGIDVGATSTTVSGNNLTGVVSGSSIGINIGSAIDTCCVTGNVCENWVTGINVNASTCDNNVVVANALPGCTTGLSDSGTGTSTNNNL